MVDDIILFLTYLTRKKCEIHCLHVGIRGCTFETLHLKFGLSLLCWKWRNDLVVNLTQVLWYHELVLPMSLSFPGLLAFLHILILECRGLPQCGRCTFCEIYLGLFNLPLFLVVQASQYRFSEIHVQTKLFFALLSAYISSKPSRMYYLSVPLGTPRSAT